MLSATRFGLLLLTAVLLAAGSACTRTYTDVTPQGTVTTRESYPQWSVARRKKDIVLPLAVRQRFEEYYRTQGHWPHSLRAFLEASSDNRAQIEGLYRCGFAWVDIVRASPDTLPLEFEFQTRTDLFFHRDDTGLPIRHDVHGRFLFIHEPNGSISFQKIVDKPAAPATLAPVRAARR